MSPTISTLASRVKASAFLERADRLSSTWSPREQPKTSTSYRLTLFEGIVSSNTLMEEVQLLDDAITRFLSALLPPQQLELTLPNDKYALIVVHTLAHASMIHLYSRFARDDPISQDKCVRSARSSVAVIKHIADADFILLDPIIGVSFR
jgi:hypothetical protein